MHKSEKALLDLAKFNDQLSRDKKVEKSRQDDIIHKQMNKIKNLQMKLDDEINSNIEK